MNLRRRLALFLDPTLVEKQEPQPEPIRLDLDTYRLSVELGRMVQALERIEKRMPPKRRPRIIECKHPELHPDDPDAVAWLAGEDAA